MIEVDAHDCNTNLGKIKIRAEKRMYGIVLYHTVLNVILTFNRFTSFEDNKAELIEHMGQMNFVANISLYEHKK